MERFLILSAVLFLSVNGQPKFPEDFKFGVATAAYQIEGGWNANGKGENIWDRLTHTHPEYVRDRTNGDTACDSYHRYRQDVRAIEDVHADFYRFSLSWSRLLPNGHANRVNLDAVKYYNALIDDLLAVNVEPVVTIFHWDLPQCLQDLGGWTNEAMVGYFRDYADVAFELFGDRVKTWITFNEPPEICVSGYGTGQNAPAFNYSGIADYLCGRTLLLAHAKAAKLYNKKYRQTQNGKIGITVSSIWSEPKTNSSKDIESAERYLQMNTGWWFHPIFSKTGDYPEVMKHRIADMSKREEYPRSRLPPFTKSQIESLKGSCDFLGLNHYSTWLTSDRSFPANAPTSQEKDVGARREQDPSWKHSAVNWLRDVPWGFRKLLNWIKREYDNPLVYVTENGFADKGGLNDVDRIHYHKGYLNSLLEAITLDKCNVKRYTVWSIIDNFEWRDGYSVKFGLYDVDFNDPNRTRTPKTSAEYYRSVIESRRP